MSFSRQALPFTAEMVQAEVIRCLVLALDTDCTCRKVYARRANKLRVAAEDVFQRRATDDEIEASTVFLIREMKGAPPPPAALPMSWHEAWTSCRRLAATL